MIFRKKENKQAEELLEAHLNTVGECLKALIDLIHNYVKGDKKYQDNGIKVHTLEGKADNLRREVEVKIHAGAFMPIYRGDYLKLADTIDKIADKAESVADLLILTEVSIPEALKKDLIAIAESLEIPFEYLRGTFQFLREDISKVHKEAEKIDKEEGKIDQMESGLIKKIYQMDNLELAAKNLLRELIGKIADISDWMQDTSDVMELTSARRRI
jgi:predicted phosphate transport protein (TIGR00153 family)